MADNFLVKKKDRLGLIGLAKKIYREEGLLKGFFKGNSLNLIKVGFLKDLIHIFIKF